MSESTKAEGRERGGVLGEDDGDSSSASIVESQTKSAQKLHFAYNFSQR